MLLLSASCTALLLLMKGGKSSPLSVWLGAFAFYVLWTLALHTLMVVVACAGETFFVMILTNRHRRFAVWLIAITLARG